MELTYNTVSKVIDQEVNLILKSFNGSCLLSRIDTTSDTIYIKIYGSCVGCPSSTIALFNVVEPILTKTFSKATILLDK